MSKKKNKKKIILLISCIVSIVLVFTVFNIWMSYKNDLIEDDYSKDIRILNENNVSLVIYGNEVKFREGVKYENIGEINKSSFKGDEFLVMNDLYSNASLDDEDFSEIKELVSNGVTFMYYGDSKFDVFKEKGFLTDQIDNGKYIGFTMRAFSTKATLYHGWSKEEEEAYKEYDEALGESIISSIVYELKIKKR